MEKQNIYGTNPRCSVAHLDCFQIEDEERPNVCRRVAVMFCQRCKKEEEEDLYISLKYYFGECESLPYW